MNCKKTKILYFHLIEDEPSYDYVLIAEDFIQVLHIESCHRYLGRRISFSSDRCNIEFYHRVQQGWAMFHRHKKCILDKHVSLKHRLKYFDVCVTPTLLFALVVLPISKTKIESMDCLQRKMLRRIVGWRRIDDEEWSITMHRMRVRLENAEILYCCEAWSKKYLRLQWRYAVYLSKQSSDLWARKINTKCHICNERHLRLLCSSQRSGAPEITMGRPPPTFLLSEMA